MTPLDGFGRFRVEGLISHSQRMNQLLGPCLGLQL